MKRIFLLLLMSLLLVFGARAEEKPTYRFTIADDDLSVVQGLDEQWTNVLLLGLDNRLDEENRGRADAIIICSIHKKNGQIRLTSTTRDLYVNIAGQKFSDKINAAFSYGGPNLMMKTVNETYGLNIEDYVSINFYGMCDMVDAIGGVEVTLSRAERQEVNNSVLWGYGEERGESLPLGTGEMTVTLKGAQALAFARIRNLDSDMGRNERQRKVLTAIVRKAATLSMGELLSLAKTCFEYVATNLSFTEMMSLGLSVLKGGMESIEQLSIPEPGMYRYVSINEKTVVKYNEEAAKKRVHEFIYGTAE